MPPRRTTKDGPFKNCSASLGAVGGDWLLEEERRSDERAGLQAAATGDAGQLPPRPRDVGRVSPTANSYLFDKDLTSRRPALSPPSTTAGLEIPTTIGPSKPSPASSLRGLRARSTARSPAMPRSCSAGRTSRQVGGGIGAVTSTLR